MTCPRGFFRKSARRTRRSTSCHLRRSWRRSSIPRRDGFDLLFGRKHGFTGWSIGKRALDKKLGLKPWTHHDIRRSVATGLANIGVQPHVVEQILNHQSGHKRGPAGIYNRSVYTNEVRAALALWSDHVRTLVEDGERKVVPMRQVP